jgi:hypothetical protein
VETDEGWTIIDPTGSVKSFPSSDALRASLPASAMLEVEERKEPSDVRALGERKGDEDLRPTTTPPGITESMLARGWGDDDDDDDDVEPLSAGDVEMVSERRVPTPAAAPVPASRATFKLFAPPPLPPQASRPPSAPVIAVATAPEGSPAVSKPPPVPSAAPRPLVVSTPPILPKSSSPIIVVEKESSPDATATPEPTPRLGSVAAVPLEPPTVPMMTAALEALMPPPARATMRGMGLQKDLLDDEVEAALLVTKVRAGTKAAESDAKTGGKLEALPVFDYLDKLENLKPLGDAEAKERLSQPPPRHRSTFPRVRDEDISTPRVSGKAATPKLPPALPPPTLPRRVRTHSFAPPEDKDNDPALAAPPPPKRGGWLVAGGMIAAAGLFVFYMQVNSENTKPGAVANAAQVAQTAQTEGQPSAKQSEPRSEQASSNSGAASSSKSSSVETASTGAQDTPSTAAAAPAAAAPTTTAAAAAPAATAKTEPAVASTTTTASAEIARPPAAVSDDSLPPNEILHRAHASLRQGDRARAKQQFAAVLAKDPSNVEASTGLGDIARADGDLAGARDHYQRALTVSPSYVPAMLALADVKWDLGEKSDAQARYAAIVDRLGDRAPARAKERR